MGAKSDYVKSLIEVQCLIQFTEKVIDASVSPLFGQGMSIAQHQR